MDPRGMRKKVAEAAARLRLSKARRDLAKLKAAKKMIEEERAEAAAERAAAELNDTEYIRWPAFRVMETIPEISETKSVDIQVHGMKARVYLSRPDEDIVPLRYLKRADKDKIVHRAVWIFRIARNGRRVNQNRWPTLETIFFDVFRNLKNTPQWDKGLFEDEAGSAATCPTNLEFRQARYNQDNTLTDNQPLHKTLSQNFQLHLGQLLTNLHHMHIHRHHLPDQEVFLINLHGSRLHVQRAIFPSSKISRIYCKKYKPVDNSNTELHTFRAGDATRRYTEQDLEHDIDQLDWLHTLKEERTEAPDEDDAPVFRVLASKEYDLWKKTDWHAALKLLAGLNRYLMGGRAKCGVMQNMFEKFPLEEVESQPVESSSSSAARR
ncbi:similar to An14g00770 [Aspergillus luchuensis]|uniref:Similar to An14g00770 n=1 Tax=Aspergillus kawachii TaxID=1069201 RepID=A0A146FHD2_ASPKA|nr:similar to An14g00770 [Aspergillus luchuensis]